MWNMFKVNNKDFTVNFEHISHLCSSVSIVNFEQVNIRQGHTEMNWLTDFIAQRVSHEYLKNTLSLSIVLTYLILINRFTVFHL